MSADEQLLAAQNTKSQPDQENSSSDRAGALREQQREGGGQEETGQSLRSQVMAARKNQTSEDAKKNEERKSISFRHSQILKQNIFNLVTSFGLSYFYIVYHWFQSKLGNKRKYVKLGSEWMDSPALTEKQRDEIGSNFAPWENCCFFSVSIGFLVAILLVILPFALIGYYLSHPAEAAWEGLSLVWSIIKSIFTS